jgi:hypothetical protein
MKIKQLSVFLENKPGQLSIPCKALANAGISILTLSLADTHQFGILRLILRDPEKGKKVLEEAGCVVNLTDVVAIEVPDRPGGLGEILEAVEAEDINLEYMYAFTYRSEDKAVIVFRFEDPDTALKILRDKNINIIDSVELYSRVKE